MMVVQLTIVGQVDGENFDTLSRPITHVGVGVEVLVADGDEVLVEVLVEVEVTDEV